MGPAGHRPLNPDGAIATPLATGMALDCRRAPFKARPAARTIASCGYQVGLLSGLYFLQRAPFFYRAERGQQLMRLNLRNGAMADDRKRFAGQSVDDLCGVACRQFRQSLFVPFPCYGFEVIFSAEQRRQLVSFALQSGIAAMRQ